jgi:hypothetical protein
LKNYSEDILSDSLYGTFRDLKTIFTPRDNVKKIIEEQRKALHDRNTSDFYNLLTERSRKNHPEYHQFIGKIEDKKLPPKKLSTGKQSEFKSLESSDYFASEMSKMYYSYWQTLRSKNDQLERSDIKELSKINLRPVKDKEGNMIFIKDQPKHSALASKISYFQNS